MHMRAYFLELFFFYQSLRNSFPFLQKQLKNGIPAVSEKFQDFWVLEIHTHSQIDMFFQRVIRIDYG